VHEPIELLVVDSRAAMRDALRASLELEDDIRVAGEPDDMLAALRFAADPAITLALVDSRLAGLQSPLGLDALRALARRVAVVVMGTGDPALYEAPYVVAGASGYWAKDDDLDVLVGLLRAAADGRRPAAERQAPTRRR
jgi:DNA-binding NarL/FixJ family response regulator